MADDHVILRNLRKKSLKFKKGEAVIIEKKQKGQLDISPNGTQTQKLSPPDTSSNRRDNDDSGNDSVTVSN